MDWRCRLFALTSLLVFAAPLSAQCYLPPTYFGIVKKKPIVAETLCQTTSTTPWGTFTESVTGRFWRSSNGSVRLDSSYATTSMWLADGKGSNVYMDNESKVATAADLPFSPEINPGPAELNLRPGTILKGVIAGRAVTGKRLDVSVEGFHYKLYDFWFADGLQLLVAHERTSDTIDLVEQVRNIEEREPDPALFKIPKNYAVVRCTLQPVTHLLSCREPAPRQKKP
jgi:hypothetical protein